MQLSHFYIFISVFATATGVVMDNNNFKFVRILRFFVFEQLILAPSSMTTTFIGSILYLRCNLEKEEHYNIFYLVFVCNFFQYERKLIKMGV